MSNLSMVKRVEAFIREHRMLRDGQRLIVAVSGGPDSMVLLRLLQDLAPQYHLILHVAHLHHGLRGREADKDELFVRNYCREQKLPFVSERADVRGLAAKKSLSFETAARMARYAFLRRCAKKISADTIVVGHHADDQVETFLMRLVRGAGVRGLRGMLPARREGDATIIRPLLCLWRSEILSCAKEFGIRYRIDRSNVDVQFLRNRVRRRLVKYLEKNYNPNVREVVRRSAELFADAYTYIHDEARKLFLSIAERRRKGSIELPLKKFLEAPPALQRELLSIAIGELGSAEAPGYNELRALSSFCEGSGEYGFHYLLGDLVAAREYGRLVLSREKEREAEKYEFPLEDGREVCSSPFLLRFSVKMLPRRDVKRLKKRPARLAAVWNGGADRLWPLIEYFSEDAVGGRPLTVRNRRAGDRYAPLGMSGEKKLMRIMMDEKLPHRLRDRVPIVTCGDDVIWLVGYRIANHYRITPGTKRVIEVAVEKIGEM
ncbi:MAG: tRNA lysidine(34) synthetase TilS [Candidatus Aureabacteria bacterium]|nr:tRNA lysidine(34) synthetase TilS [Candidatus Auribacterota bacterium]